MLKDIYQKWYWSKPSAECGKCLGRPHSSCPDLVQGLLSPMYGDHLYCTACREAASLAVRDEHLLAGHDRIRFARRLHIFDLPSNNGAPADTNDRSDNELARYLGCVNMRSPKESIQPGGLLRVAEGFLRLPRRMRSADYDFPLLSALYTPFFGLLPFGCIPYASQTASVSGFCAQTCVYMCLLISVREGGVARGPFSLTCQAKYARELKLKDVTPEAKAHTGEPTIVQHGKVLKDTKRCIDGGSHAGTAFKITGLSLLDMVGLLNNSDLDKNETTSGQPDPLFAYMDGLPHSHLNQLAQVIYGYAQSGAPLIVLVNNNVLWETVPYDRKQWRHSVVVIGTRGKPWDTKHFAVVYHDPSKGPYREAPFAHFAHAATSWRRFDGKVKSNAYMVPVFPSDVKLRFDHLRKLIPRKREEVGPLFLRPKYWTLRLIRNGAIEDCTPDDLPAEQAAEFKSRMRAHLEPPCYTWCFEHYDSIRSARRHLPDRCILYDGTSDSGEADITEAAEACLGGYTRPEPTLLKIWRHDNYELGCVDEMACLEKFGFTGVHV